MKLKKSNIIDNYLGQIKIKKNNLCENRCIFFSIINNQIINQKENDCFFIYNNEQKFFIGNKRKKKL